MCQGCLKQMGLNAIGTKCQLGEMHGHFSHEMLNATHSGMLVAQRCNSDVQLPYRCPILPSTHFCDDPSCLEYSQKLMIEATQIAQDAQAGYAYDCCTKRQPMAFNECMESVKGHRQLASDLRNEGLNRIGKRHAMRLSDAYGKGIVRAQVENVNLRAYGFTSDVTSAESFKTCGTASFFGQNYVDIVENLNDEKRSSNSTVIAGFDVRNKRHRKIAFRDVGAFYGYRPRDDRMWYLSPYKFVTEWQVVPVNYPQSLTTTHDASYQAYLIEEGINVLKASQKKKHPRLEAGIHYRVKDDPGIDFIPFLVA